LDQWPEGLKAKVGVRAVYDLSATPFFLSGSGYPEGTLFPWVVSDFSLMTPSKAGSSNCRRVPVADNLPIATCPSTGSSGNTSARRCRRRGAGKDGELNPLELPTKLLTRFGRTLQSLCSGGSDAMAACWDPGSAGVHRRLQQHSATSKLVLRMDRWLGPAEWTMASWSIATTGNLALFRNYDENGNRLAKPLPC